MLIALKQLPYPEEYAMDSLQEVGLLECKPKELLIIQRLQLYKWRLVPKIIYPTVTQPDLLCNWCYKSVHASA